MRILGIVCLTGMLLSASVAIMVDKVVIIPLGGAKNYMNWKGDWAIDTEYKVGDVFVG